jgi:hypothetical protein
MPMMIPTVDPKTLAPTLQPSTPAATADTDFPLPKLLPSAVTTAINSEVGDPAQMRSPQSVGIYGQGVPSAVGESTTRPRVAQPGEFLANRVSDDLVVPRLADHNGRLKSTLKGIERGFFRGGLPGAIIGGATYATDPSLDEREDQAAQTANDIGRYNDYLSMMKTRTALDEQASMNRYRDSEAYKNLHPPPDFQRIEGDDGFFLYDKNNPAAGMMKLPIAPKGSKPQAFDWMGRKYEWEKDPDSNKWVPHSIDSLPLDESEVPVDYLGYKVKPGVAASGVAQTTAANITAGNQYANQSYEDTVRAGDKAFDDDLGRYTSATQARERVLGAYSTLNNVIARRDAAAKDIENWRKIENSVSDPATKDKAMQARQNAEANWQQANEEAAASRATLEAESRGAEATGYVKVDPQTGWATELLPRPQRLPYPQRPTPQARPAPTQASVPGATPSNVQSVIDRVRRRGGGGAYAGHMFKLADLPEIQRRLGVSTPAEARAIVEREGGRFGDDPLGLYR